MGPLCIQEVGKESQTGFDGCPKSSSKVFVSTIKHIYNWVALYKSTICLAVSTTLGLCYIMHFFRPPQYSLHWVLRLATVIGVEVAKPKSGR